MALIVRRETKVYGDYINDNNQFVEIRYDEDCENPRRDDDGLYSHFYTYTREYCSPDTERLYTYHRGIIDRAPSLWEILEEFIDTAYGYRDDDPEWMDDLMCTEGDGRDYLFEVIDYINEHGGVALPVSMYDHSSIGYSVGHPGQFVGAYPWDAGYAGLIYAKDEDIKRNFMVDEVTDELRERVRKCFADEVKYYSHWANGQCFYYNLYDKSGTIIDSHGGFIGDDVTESSIEYYTGKLEETSMSLDDWMDSIA